MLEKVKVNPRIVNGAPLRVEDQIGRVIKRSAEGTLVSLNTYYSRLIKAEDLVVIEKPKPDPEPEPEPKLKTEPKKPGKAGKKKEG